MTTFTHQLRAAAAQHDNASPPDEPAFGLDEAAAAVATRETPGELVDTLADAAPALAWLSRSIPVDHLHLDAFRALLELSERLAREREREYERLNAVEGRPDDC